MRSFDVARFVFPWMLVVFNAVTAPVATASTECVGSAGDTFDDGLLTPLWIDASTALCGTVSESSGKIVLDKPAGCVGFALARLETAVLCGDFDVQIDYQLEFPAASTAGGSIHGIQLRVTGTNQLVAGAERYRETSNSCVPHTDAYKLYTTNPGCTPQATYIPTADVQGKFRITRQGTTVKAYYWSGGSWTAGLTGSITAADLYLQLNSGTNGTYTAHVSGTFDNLIVRSAVCMTSLWENFSESTLNSIWLPTTSCGTPAVSYPELHLAKLSGCTGGPYVTLDPSVYILRGDFDVSASFSLPSFPVPPVQDPAGARWFSLQIHRASDLSTGNVLAVIQRYNRLVGDCANFGNNYKAFTTNPLNCASSWADATGDSDGKLRITRTGNMFRMYYWNEGTNDWEELRSEVGSTADAVIRLNSGTGVDTAAHDGRFYDVRIVAGPLTDIGDAPSSGQSVVTLGVNYPNPFNPSTTITFALSEKREAILTIHDVRGALVRTLVRGEQAAGMHYATWDGTDDGGAPASSGVYFLRAKSGPSVVSRKIVLLK